MYDSSKDQSITSEFTSPSKINAKGTWYLLVNELVTLYKLGFKNPVAKEASDKEFYLLEEGSMKAILSSMKIVK